jgi:hypothetical protein
MDGRRRWLLEIDQCDCEHQDSASANQKLFDFSIEHNSPLRTRRLFDTATPVESIALRGENSGLAFEGSDR